MLRGQTCKPFLSAICCIAVFAAIGGCPADDGGTSGDDSAGNAAPTRTTASPLHTDEVTELPVNDKASAGNPTLNGVPESKMKDTEPPTIDESTSPAQEFPHSGVSNAGAYRIGYRTNPDPLPLNQMFRVAFQVFDAKADDAPITDAEVLVDAAMPAHGHGMNTSPVVTLGEDGVYEAAGMLFHMSGHWELYFDVTRNGITERAQFDVNLE